MQRLRLIAWKCAGCGEREAKPFIPHAARVNHGSAPIQIDKTSLVQFWDKQHAAMDAMKREGNFAKAAQQLFREALAINPDHEDSHYYLANCLAALGDIPSAIAELDALARINPQNHRAFQREGELLAASASSGSQLELARHSLEAALRLNSEETGTPVLLGQVALAQETSQGRNNTLRMLARLILAQRMCGFCAATSPGDNGTTRKRRLCWPTHATPGATIGSQPDRCSKAMCSVGCTVSPASSMCSNSNGMVPRTLPAPMLHWTRTFAASGDGGHYGRKQ